MMVTPRGMLNDANPLMPYRSDKLAICGQRVSNTDPEVPTRLLHYRGYECIWLFSLAFFWLQFQSQFGISSVGLMCHVMYIKKSFHITITYIRI